MGKVKSAIITALVVAAVLILSLFAVISCPLNEVDRYNSFVSSIHMGGDLTGEAYALFYPEGVISEADYNLKVASTPDEKDNYQKRGSVYVENELIETAEQEAEFKSSVSSDAAIINARFGAKGYTSYSVSVVDSFVIRVSVPTNFTYAAYKELDSASRESELTAIGYTFNYLTLSGELDLRNGTDDTAKSVISVNAGGFATFFKDVNYYALAGNHYVRMNLTDDGYSRLSNLLLSESEGSVYIFVGDTCMQLSINYGESLQSKTLGFSVNEAYAKDFAIILNSVTTDNVLANNYNDGGSDTEVIALTATYGDAAVIVLFVLLLLVLVGAAVASIVRYKKLGLVNALVLLTFAAVMITAIFLTELQFTVVGAFMLLLGFALLAFSNFHVFEAVRKETLTGRSIQASVKTGYRKCLATILDLHIVILVVAALVALICTGELAACGLILFIATVASYALYWFTRFMWYVVSSPMRDKFGFCGFKREVFDDED